MQTNIKIVLYPEVHKSKNGAVFEKLMRGIFQRHTYEIEMNRNEVGLEIDLYAKHKITKKTVFIECKAKKKPKSGEIKNFAFSIGHKKADEGYFLYTEELDHQASTLVDELINDSDKRYSNLQFLGPDQIIDLLVDNGLIRKLSKIDLPQEIIHIKTFVYGYFGMYYILQTSTTTNPQKYYVLDAKTLEDVDLTIIADSEHVSNIDISTALLIEMPELDDLHHSLIKKSESMEKILSNKLSIEIRTEFEIELDSLGATFSHSQTNEIKLNDVFIPPTLQEFIIEGGEKKKKQHFEMTQLLSVKNSNQIRWLFVGDERSGKSTISRYLFNWLFHEDYIPIFINGGEIKSIRSQSFIDKELKIAFNNQYNNPNSFNKLNTNDIIIIIDDFHKLNLKKKEAYVNVFIRNLCKIYKNIIITGDGLLPIRSLISKSEKSKDVFRDFRMFKIFEFGHNLRYKLIQKWYSLGQESGMIDTNELFRKSDKAKRLIDSIIGKNYIPSYPIYILSILQALETDSLQKPESNLHGFYYELLINQALASAIKNKDDISFYYNYITFLSFELFTLKTLIISQKQFHDFHTKYCKEYDIEINVDTVKRILKNAGIILINNHIKIKHRYIYYFFVAKYFTNHLNDDTIKTITTQMCKTVHLEEHANIIMFMTHLSKDQFILSEILNSAKEIFSEYEIAEIGQDVQKINQLVQNIPEQILDVVNDAKRFREDEFSEKDERELLEKEHDSDEVEYEIDGNLDEIDLLSQMTLSFKTIEILGQLLKKYWGEMVGSQKEMFVLEAYRLGLRTLKFFFNLVLEDPEIIIDFLKRIISKKFIKDNELENVDPDKLKEAASQFLFGLCYLISFGTIKKIANSVGYEKLTTTFDKIDKEYQINSIRLINISINLDFHGFDFKNIKEEKQKIEKNHLAYTILQNLVMDYLYMFDTTFKEKQQICDLLGIKIKEQHNIDKESKIKKKKSVRSKKLLPIKKK